jgi:hypothetical protein
MIAFCCFGRFNLTENRLVTGCLLETGGGPGNFVKNPNKITANFAHGHRSIM